jgi:DNA polymerase V
MPLPGPVYPSVVALVDCNSFYASCERIFRPDLHGRAVVVLSNNDGCIVAASTEAKAVGIRTGQPFFLVKDKVRLCGAAVFSSNYAFYGDMSRRVVSVLGRFAVSLEPYSIDESFLQLPSMAPARLHQLAGEIVAAVNREVGLPVCVGIGATKVLAKAANRMAKKDPALGGKFVFEGSEAQREQVLDGMAVGDLWGIGSRQAEKLQAAGIHTAGDFMRCQDGLIRKLMGVVGLRLAYELRGVSCLSLEEVSAPKKSILSSRSFGAPVTELAKLEEAVSAYACRAAEKLRRQHSVCRQMEVFLSTNRFHSGAPQYRNAVTQPLPGATADSTVLSAMAKEGLRKIWRPGFAYQKAGVVLWEIVPEASLGETLFGEQDYPEKRREIMKVMDRINARHGRGTVRLAASAFSRTWQMRQENLSPCYTTDWNALPKVLAA